MNILKTDEIRYNDKFDTTTFLLGTKCVVVTSPDCITHLQLIKVNVMTSYIISARNIHFQNVMTSYIISARNIHFQTI